MAQQYNDNVIIDGTEDEVQLTVQGYDTQTEALQEWQDHNGNPLARITADGRFQSGDMPLTTPDALIEAHRDEPSSLPQRGIHSLGKIAGVITTAIAWMVGELELVGTAAISSIQTAVRGRLTHSSTGDSSNAELRAGDFESINQSGTSGTPVGTAVGVQATVDNQQNAYLTKASGIVAKIQNATGADIETAVALEVAPPVNDGTIDTLIGLDIPDINEGTDNYALRTGDGVVHVGDVMELAQLASDPANKADVVQFYGKDDKIFAKAPDPDNTVYDLTQGVGDDVYINVLRGDGYPANSPVYIGEDGKAYLCNEYLGSSYEMGAVRGFSLDAGPGDELSTIQIKGILGGFTGLTPGKKVYFRTPTSISQTPPPLEYLNVTKGIGEMGIAISATEIYIDPKPVQYHYRVNMTSIGEGGTVTLEHHSDHNSHKRNTWAHLTENTLGAEVTGYGSENQDEDVDLQQGSELRQDLISWWSLDETSGTRVDNHGSNDLIDNNTVPSLTGKQSNAADFTRSNSESLSVADNASLKMGDIDFTIGCWVKLDSKPSSMGIIGKWVGDTEYLIFYNAGTDRFALSINNGTTGGGPHANSLGSPSTGVWYYIVAWHDSVNNQAHIQVNNGAVDTVSWTTGVQAGSGNFAIGRYDSNYLDGQVDEAFLFKRRLESAERSWLYNGGSGRSYSETDIAVGTKTKLAQTFTLGSSTDISKLGLWLKKVGNPDGYIYVNIETTSGGLPTGTLADPNAHGSIWKSQLSEGYSEILVDLFDTVTLAAGTYAIVLYIVGSISETNYIVWGADASSPGYSGGEMLSEVDGAWTSESKDAIFTLYELGTRLPARASVDSWNSQHAEIVNRYGDDVGDDVDTRTTFKITRPTGFYEVTFVVEID